MEIHFHSQFYQTELDVTITNFGRLRQKLGENVETYIARFKNARNRCKARLPENEYLRLAIDNLKSTLRMQFFGQQFTDLCHLVDMVARYEKVIEEENQRKTTNRGIYYKS